MFVVVAEELNFREAALRLHMTQPPLSRQIQELEASLSATLLLRLPRGVALTPAGERLLVEARRLLAMCEEMTQFFCQSVAEPVNLKLGLTTVGDTETFAQILPKLQAQIPHLNVSFKRQGSVKSVRDIHQHRLDAAIIGMPSKTQELTVRQLYRDEFCVALPAGHRLHNKRTIALRELNEDSLFWFKRDGNAGFYDHCEDFFKKVGFAPQRIPEPSDHHVLLSMIANGGGIGLIPESLCKIRRGGVIYRTLEERHQFYIDVSIAYATPVKKPTLALFIEKLIQVFETDVGCWRGLNSDPGADAAM